MSTICLWLRNSSVHHSFCHVPIASCAPGFASNATKNRSAPYSDPARARSMSLTTAASAEEPMIDPPFRSLGS